MERIHYSVNRFTNMSYYFDGYNEYKEDFKKLIKSNDFLVCNTGFCVHVRLFHVLVLITYIRSRSVLQVSIV